jgi:hypothetical protein
MTATTPNSFRLLQSVFDDRMNGLERADASDDKSHAETKMVRTYILELTHNSLPENKLRNALHEIFTTPPSSSVKALQASFSEHDKLLNVTGHYRRKRVTAYVDFRDSRFLRLHSTTKSDLLNDLVLGWTDKSPELDHAWLDDSFLDWCSKLGDFRGVAVEFNTQPLTARDFRDANADEKSKSMRLRQSGEPHESEKLLELLRHSPDFKKQSSLAMVRVKREDAMDRTTSEIRYDGRISGRGNSFVRHSEITEKIVDRYRKRVLDVERRFSVSAKKVGEGYSLTGGPVRIDLHEEITDLKAFCGRLFGAINPFRLSGMPHQVAKDHFVVRAVDLHTAQTLRFELRPNRIWVFLPSGTCGNTLLRFITNLQRHHSRLVTAPQLDGEPNGALQS